MSKWLKRLVTICLLTFLVIWGSFAVIIYRGTFNPPVHTYAISIDEPLTEEVALSYTRQAMIDDGKGATHLAPVKYWPDSQYSEDDTDAERFFARNTIDPNNGYVIWDNGLRYHVQIERDEDSVQCRVFSPK